MAIILCGPDMGIPHKNIQTIADMPSKLPLTSNISLKEFLCSRKAIFLPKEMGLINYTMEF